MSAKQEIISKIKETIAPDIEEWEIGIFDYLKKMEKYCKEDVYKEGKGSVQIFKLKSKAGYTKAMERFFGLKQDDLKKLIHKEAEAKLSKIDVAVNKKLENVEVTSVELISFSTKAKDKYCEGAWKINNDKIFSFKTIYAGGWNIQQFHIRTIYNYK